MSEELVIKQESVCVCVYEFKDVIYTVLFFYLMFDDKLLCPVAVDKLVIVC